jgi:hypothetical protein
MRANGFDPVSSDPPTIMFSTGRWAGCASIWSISTPGCTHASITWSSTQMARRTQSSSEERASSTMRRARYRAERTIAPPPFRPAVSAVIPCRAARLSGLPGGWLSAAVC